MKPICAFLLLLTVHSLFAQQSADSNTKEMEEVVIRAFEQNRKLKDVPAAVNYIPRSALDRSSPTSVLQAINSMPGARMEERSPGSYRFNIRGSSLRSPFGVRNVKVYFNDLPMTDPGGNTYFNQLGYYNFNSIEIIKGPGSSLYGAGTGGVLLIESLSENEAPGAFVEYAGGSYQLRNIYASITTGNKNLVSRAGFQHQENEGYRNHSSLKRDVHSWTGLFRINEKKILKTSFLYGDLFYETPGALTRSEYGADPKAARPGGGGFPGSEAAHASIRQRTFLAGASYDQELGPRWQNKSVLYGMFTELRNPTLRNYGRSSEPHVGGRTLFTFNRPMVKSIFRFQVGGEWQEGFTSLSIHKNVAGNADSLRTYDEINNRQQFLFSQATLDLSEWIITAGASFNQMRIRFQRFTPASLGLQKKSFNNQVAPRFSLLRRLGTWNIYTSVSKGFSPPTTAELLPTGGTINFDLDPERGLNYDLGLKGLIFNKLTIDVNAFIFLLENTIVQRRDAGGGDFFVNAGKTRQHGIETYLGYPLFDHKGIMDRGLFWISHTWHDFHYKEFKQLTTDYSGKQLPGEPEHAVSAGYDFSFKNGFLGTLTYYFAGRVALNDANSEYAEEYHLAGLKLGYQKWIREKWRFKLMAGADNLLDQKYSLGNDINGFGGRYYNAAPRRNYYAALLVQWVSKKYLR